MASAETGENRGGDQTRILVEVEENMRLQIADANIWQQYHLTISLIDLLFDHINQSGD